MNNELNITGVKHGLITGAIIALVVIGCGAAGRNLYMGVAQWLAMGLTLALPIYLGFKEREKLEGYLSWTPAFVYLGIIFFISAVFWEFADVTVLGVIDPGIIDVMLEESMPAAEQAMRMFIDDESLIDQQMAEAEIQIRKKGSYMFLLSTSWWFVVKAAALGALAALIIKKKKPDFEEEVSE